MLIKNEFKKIINELGEGYLVNDIITKETKYIFLLESPHVQELKHGAPVSGGSGKSMTKHLFEETYDLPLGILLKNNVDNDTLKKFGLMNVCQIPMQEKAYGDEEVQEKYKDFFDKLEKVRTSSVNKFKDEDTNQLKEAVVEIFKEKLELYKDREFVVIPCGKFAEKFFKLAGVKSDKWTIIEGVPHPSYNSWSRERYKEVIDKIKSLV